MSQRGALQFEEAMRLSPARAAKPVWRSGENKPLWRAQPRVPLIPLYPHSHQTLDEMLNKGYHRLGLPP